MNLLIKQAKILATNSPFYNKVMDILIEGGVIVEIKKSITPKGNIKIIEGEELNISNGWVDMQAVACDPGFEYKETLETLIKGAAAGGFTSVCIHNYNNPALHNKSQIEYVLNKTENKLVKVLPFGTISINGKGKDLAEMHDMKKSGAIGFSDYKHPIQDAGMVMRALQYSENVNSFIVTHCDDESISNGGQINEGEVSTALGLKGIPVLAEELNLQRNLAILEYTGGKLHIPTVSTKGSVELLKKAKASGLNVTCGVAAINLFLDDTNLTEFDTNYKINPPLRSKKDVQALRSGITSGIIDVIVSDHFPQDVESKDLEFDLADFGMINIQTAFSCALEALKDKNIDSIIKSLTDNAYSILGIKTPIIEEGSEANLTLFSIKDSTTLTEKTNYSKSKNSPFFNKPLTGKVIGIVNGTKSFFN
ncbi:MAG: dihydroorotase [Bacteroidota bacterium]|nr:dihydroorotase [Bacteroidota bacterium]MDP3145726.1 dihydroorotase [Bacteroidota bacterium]